MGEGLAVRNEDRGAELGSSNPGVPRQRFDKPGVLPAAGDPEKKFYYWLRKLRTQALERHSHRLCQYRRALSQRMCSKFIFEARICGFPER